MGPLKFIPKNRNFVICLGYFVCLKNPRINGYKALRREALI